MSEGGARALAGWQGRLARGVASVGGIGHLRPAPGTLASLLAVLAGWGLMRLGQAALPEAALFAAMGGLAACAFCGAAEQDPSWIVIDEVAGQWLAMVTLLRPSPAGLVAAFVLFRLLDITKPGPVGWADRTHNAAGVMADDLIAGGMVALLLWVVQAQWPALLTP